MKSLSFSQVWNLETMLPIQTLIRHEAAVLSIALQGDLLLSGSEDNDVKVIISLYCLLPPPFQADTPSHETTSAADGTRPTGMHSC